MKNNCKLTHICFFFFFQAEDGIRDTSVTGVQTCALPISVFDKVENWRSCSAATPPIFDLVKNCAAVVVEGATVMERSEERRVGRECRCGGGREGGKRKEIKRGRDGRWVIRKTVRVELSRM